jgi:hypothetical protein
VIHYDNKNHGFTRLNIKLKKLLTDSIYVWAAYAYHQEIQSTSIINKFEIKLLSVRRREREREG